MTPPISLADQIREAQKELALKERVFPGWVKAGRLSMEDAYHRLAAQRAIVRSLETLLMQHAQLPLFERLPSERL